jgi:hypothetical protein
MTLKKETVSNVDDVTDVALHDEIKLRAYQLYERKGNDPEDHDLKSELKSELLRVVYAASQLQNCSNGEVRDNKAIRAARIYLRALAAFIDQA